MITWIELFITIFAAVLGSGGLWAYLQRKTEKKDDRTKLLLGLAHERIVFLSLRYLDAGAITKDEYESLHDYLFQPYLALGGDGTAELLMKRVEKLPMSGGVPYELLKGQFANLNS